MARKINVKLILELREASLSRNFIADSRHFARNSVSDVFRIADERGITVLDSGRSKDELSAALGRLCAVLSVEDRGFADKLAAMIASETERRI